jgi:hypothetical protein
LATRTTFASARAAPDQTNQAINAMAAISGRGIKSSLGPQIIGYQVLRPIAP